MNSVLSDRPPDQGWRVLVSADSLPPGVICEVPVSGEGTVGLFLVDPVFHGDMRLRSRR